MSKLTVLDPTTGTQIELPISKHNTIDSKLLQAIKIIPTTPASSDPVPLRIFDPGFKVDSFKY